MTFLNVKTLSIAILVVILLPSKGSGLEIEDPQGLIDGDFFKIEPKRSPRLLTTRFGKRRLITTRFGKRDGRSVGSNLDGTSDDINWSLKDDREKMANGRDSWQAQTSGRNMEYSPPLYNQHLPFQKMDKSIRREKEFYNPFNRLDF